jgi:hypothetical protein
VVELEAAVLHVQGGRIGHRAGLPAADASAARGRSVEGGNIGTPNTSGAGHLGVTRRRPSLPDAVRIQQTSALRPSCLNRVRFGGRLRRSGPPRPGSGSAGRARQG